MILNNFLKLFINKIIVKNNTGIELNFIKIAKTAKAKLK